MDINGGLGSIQVNQKPLSGGAGVRKCLLLCLCIGLLAVGSCSRLSGDERLENLVDLTELPAAYGHLVAITQYGNPVLRPGWYEMWFSNPESGQITLVPMWRPTRQYDPSRIFVIERN